MDFSLFHLGTPGEGNSYPLQYSGLENSMNCIVHGVAKSQTQLSEFGSMGSMIKIGINFSEGSIID